MRITVRLVLALFLALAVAGGAVVGPAPAVAQDAAAAEPDYAAWSKFAKEVDAALTADRTPNDRLNALRATIAEWRAKFLDAQSANAAQIGTVKNQISALGPAPTADNPDAPEIAARRKELNDQLARLQAPGLEAVEAYSHADGLIRRIDATIRARQASELLRLSPSPLNPINWPAGLAVATQGAKTLWAETRDAWQDAGRRAELRNKLPVILLLIAVAAVLMWRGPDFIERLTQRLQTGASMRGRHVAAGLLSLGQFVVPVGGMVLLVLAIQTTGMAGSRMSALIKVLPFAAFLFFAARWIGSWLFRSEGAGIRLTDRPAEARFHVNMLALILALEAFRRAFTTEVRPPLSQAAQAVWAAPAVCLAAIFVFRLGLLLRPRPGGAGQDQADFRLRIQKLIANALLVVALVAPALALIGYVNAANALIWPTVSSLGLMGMILLLQRFGTDIYLLASRRGEEGRDALVPVLIGFALTLAALPLFALAWGARVTDLAEVWSSFAQGIPLGETRLSPGVILTFALIFALGFAITRLVQGALKSVVMPRTQLDKGVRNAVVSGVGYVGIVLAALVAVTGAGINLSSLAIVAGALSVGIGFGLQNIVQNFVSGIILLIERPISEGDMIEVNGQFGTVKGISVRSTWIETFDRTDVIVPNADLVSGVVTNLTRGNLTGRLIIPLGVAYGSDTRKVQAILAEIAEAQPLVMVDPAPRVFFVAFGADSLNFEIRAILSDVNFKFDVQTEILHQINERFAAEGIEIPFAQRDLWIRNPEALHGGAAQPSVEATARAQARTAGEPSARPDPRLIRNDPSEDDGDEA